jgi:hypothetical protein
VNLLKPEDGVKQWDPQTFESVESGKKKAMGPGNRVNRRGHKNMKLCNLEDLENDVKQWDP